MLVLLPLPLEVTPPGYLVRVQLPEDGSPDNTTLPVDTLQVGWVIVPVPGAPGVTGWEFMLTEAVEPDVQPSLFLTVQE